MAYVVANRIRQVAEDVGASYASLGEVIRELDGTYTRRQWQGRVLIVVARGAEPHYDYLSRAFAGVEWAQVIVDRRLGERRTRDRGHPLDPRNRDRRRRPDADARLQTAPCAVVDVTESAPLT